MVLLKGVTQTPNKIDWPLGVFLVLKRELFQHLVDPNLGHAFPAVVSVIKPRVSTVFGALLRHRLSAYDIVQHEHVHDDELRHMIFWIDKGRKVLRCELN